MIDDHLSDEEYLRKHRGLLQVAVAPHAAAGIGPQLMRDATDEELLAFRRMTLTPAFLTGSTLITDKSVMPARERKLRELLAIRCAGAALYADDGELSDSSRQPFIDFLRDDPEVIEAKLKVRNSEQTRGLYEGKEVIIDYTNWRGERRLRRIVPHNMMFGSNQWHTEPQWMLMAVDLEDEKNQSAIKSFALSGIHMLTGDIKWIKSALSVEKANAIPNT